MPVCPRRFTRPNNYRYPGGVPVRWCHDVHHRPARRGPGRPWRRAVPVVVQQPDWTSSDGHTDHQHSDEPVVTGQPAGYNADDVAFATNMIPAPPAGRRPGRAGARPFDQPRADRAGVSRSRPHRNRRSNTMKVFLVQWNENPDTDTGSGHGGHGIDAGHGRRGHHGQAAVAERHRVRHPVAAVDDRPPPGRHRDGARPRSPTARTSTPRAWPRTSSTRSRPRSTR